ncbi:hypothetical protein Tco_0858638 [Tanacetum coccineum]|uniref:Uncharacterized protein n=1 Tax=Tanacetum coccineum TaxID=301880 RepID=A0ABQ5BDG9_9ASTR
MVAYLKKPEGSEGFHQIVDFLNASHIRYALTENLTIYVSLIKQFWETATARTLDNGEIELTATIDDKVKIVTEASVRRHLKLADSNGISSLPTTKIFEQLSLMGYVSTSDKLTFQKGHFSPKWRFLIHTILHCLSPKKTFWEQFSSNIATTIVCLATNRKFSFSKLIFDGMVEKLDSKHKFLMDPRFIQVFLNKHKRLLQPHSRLYIASTHTQKLFSNMKRASKGYTGEDIPLFSAMIVQGEGSTHPVESHHTPTSVPSTSPPPISPTSRRTTRQEYVVPQPRSPTQTHVADEAASISVDVRYEGATTIALDYIQRQGHEIQGYKHDMEFDFDFDALRRSFYCEKRVRTIKPVSTLVQQLLLSARKCQPKDKGKDKKWAEFDIVKTRQSCSKNKKRLDLKCYKETEKEKSTLKLNKQECLQSLSTRERATLPITWEDPYLEAALQAPPSPDYVPGPEEPEQAPLSPDYVPGPEHADDEIETDPEADPEEDPIDYPADGGDDKDDEMDIEEDEDDDMDIDADEEDRDDEMDVKVDKEAEEEHPAPAYPVVVALPATAPSTEETGPFETDKSAATPPPHPAYRMTARITIPEPVPVPA